MSASNSSWIALFESLWKDIMTKKIKPEVEPETTPEPLQLRTKAYENKRKDQYLPRKGESGRAVSPVFSTNIG